jgi:hypothetical protein
MGNFDTEAKPGLGLTRKLDLIRPREKHGNAKMGENSEVSEFWRRKSKIPVLGNCRENRDFMPILGRRKEVNIIREKAGREMAGGGILG